MEEPAYGGCLASLWEEIINDKVREDGFSPLIPVFSCYPLQKQWSSTPNRDFSLR
jgi:hypothetical protein